MLTGTELHRLPRAPLAWSRNVALDVPSTLGGENGPLLLRFLSGQ
jgi:hypothetical protein